MANCANCGATIEDDARLCSNCGANVDTEAGVAHRREQRGRRTLGTGGAFLLVVGVIVVGALLWMWLTP